MPNEPFDPDCIFFRNLPADFILGDDPAQQRLLREYGSVFVASGGAIPPDRVVFRDEDEVRDFQSTLDVTESPIGPFTIELQSVAMARLLTAVDEAAEAGLSITPRGADSARRNYSETIELWKSRVEPALDHWAGNGRMTIEQAEAIRSRPPYDQLPLVFALEEDGIYFAKDLSKSIIYSVAPPGTSQHLSLLAFDAAEFNDPAVRRILANNYWYQTVTSDLPHFTFLGVPMDELHERGLRKVVNSEREFWVPDL